MLLDPPSQDTAPDSLGLFTRYGESVANIVPETETDIDSLLYSAGFREPEEKPPTPRKPFFNVPPPKDIPETLTDVAAGITKALPFLAAGELGGEAAASELGLGTKATKVVKTASGFGLQGLTQSPTQGVEDATLGAAFGAVEGLPLKGKLIAAPLIGLFTGAEAYKETNSPTAAVVQGSVNAAIPFLLKGRRVEDADSAPAKAIETPPLGETHPLFKSAEESAGVITGEIPEANAPASSAIQKQQLAEHYRYQEILDLEDKAGEPPKVATLQTGKTPLEQPIVIDGKTYSFKEDVDVALKDSLTARKETAAQVTQSLDINPSRQLKLTTVLHPDDSEMIQKAAKKLDLEFTGVHGDGEQLLFTDPKAETPTTFSVPVGATMKDLRNRLEAPEPKIATLQKPAVQPPLKENIPPSSLENPATTSGTFEVNARVLHDFGDGPELSIIRKSEGGENVIQSAISGEFREKVPDAKLKPVGASRVAQAFASDTKVTDLVESVGNLEEVEKQNVEKMVRGMKRPTGEAGFITPEVAMVLGRYVATPITAGIVSGALSDDDHRAQNALRGAAIAFGLAHFGPRWVKALVKKFPDATDVDGKITPNRVVQGIKSLATETKEDIANISAARAATKADGTVTPLDRMARWLQKNWGVNLDATRISDLSRGQANDLTQIADNALKGLVRANLSPDVRKTVGDYISGEFKGSTDQFIKAVGNKQIAQLTIAARETADSAQQIIIDSLPKGSKLRNQIEASKGKYLTSTYKIFHEKWTPPQDAIEKAAKALEGPYGSTEERLGVIQQYLHEAAATREMFNRGMFKYGEKLGQILQRKEELSPEFRALLGEYTDPIEKLAVTGMKLVNGARVASMINYTMEGTKSNGLKFAYAAEELSGIKENIRARLAITKDPKEIATLQNQLSDLRKYVWTPENANFGRLSNKWVDIHIHDDLATYDSVVTTSATRVGEIIRQTNNLFRYGHVALNPLQYARQVLNAPLLGMMSRTTPVDWYKAAQTLWKGGEELDRLKRLNIIGADYIQGQFRQDMNAFVQNRLDKWIYSNAVGRGLRQWENIFRGPDLTVRVSAFQMKEAQLLRQGLSAAEAEKAAMDYTNRYTMNYSAVPPGLMKARQYPLVNQFLTFAYESGRIAFNLAQDAVGQGPEKRIDLGAAAILTTLATTPFILQGLSEHGMSDQDKQDWERIKNLGPTYAKGNFRFYTGRDENGNMGYIDFTPLIIHDSWTKMFRDAIHGDLPALGADNPMFGWENTPLLNVAAKQVSGTDYHTGEKLNTLGARVNSIRRDLAPSIFGAELDRWAEALTPNQEGGLGVTSSRTGRSISTKGILFSYLTSIRAYTSNPDYMVQRALYQNQQEINDSAMEYRRVALSNASDSVKAAAFNRFYSKQQQIFGKLMDQLGINQPAPPQ